MKPEEKARQKIERQLSACGWIVQDYSEMNISAGPVAVREFPLTSGFADYLLYIDAKAVGIVEAKPEGYTLTGVESQSAKYTEGLPPVDEQKRIVNSVDDCFTIIRQAESLIDANLKRSARLRQSILKRAFEGKLVPQDPTDEPAEELLASLRAMRLTQHDARMSRRTQRGQGSRRTQHD